MQVPAEEPQVVVLANVRPFDPPERLQQLLSTHVPATNGWKQALGAEHDGYAVRVYAREPAS
jgi:hypothetical protein